ncbi:MAG TPA: glycosyltransferase family 4 protein [Castellaniella sp.]|uniref:glycosyltransferase family 4 protein n=1 Tax=Castellaniella sp. TaxID=1955812 RepID=UPI002F0C9649
MKLVRFVVAGDPDQYTGGYLYDARIAQALRQSGWSVDVVGLEGRFPDPDVRAGEALNAALAGFSPDDLVVIDGLALGGLPDVLARYAHTLRMVALIHHPLADEYGLGSAQAGQFRASERCALKWVSHVMTTSAFTARHLVADYGVPPHAIDVVEPGVDHPLAQGLQSPLVAHDDTEASPRLLCVATLVPRKGHLVLVEALAGLRDLAWQCNCVGDLQRDPACAEAVRLAIGHHRLQDRVRLLGTLPPAALATTYDRAQVFVLPSYYEGYGMVVAEALAHGLPIVATSGGALVQTVPEGAGLLVPPGDVAALTDALRQVLVDYRLRHALQTEAARVGGALASWDAQGARFAAVLARVAQQEVAQ